MSVATLNKWAQERMKTPEGGWSADTMSCILYGLENRAPYTWERNEEAKQEYMRLIEVACTYLKEAGTLKDAFELGIGIEEDRNHFPEKSYYEVITLVRSALSKV